MSLSIADVYHIARLARLRIDAREADRYATDLSDILKLVERMNAVDAGQVEPMAHPRDMRLRLRDDAVTEGDRRDALLAVAPVAEQDLYLVPKVIE